MAGDWGGRKYLTWFLFYFEHVEGSKRLVLQGFLLFSFLNVAMNRAH